MSNINISFIYHGTNITLQAKSDQLFAEIAFKYMQQKGIKYEEDDPKFLFNGRELVISSARTLEEYKLKNMSRIDVILRKDVTIGPPYKILGSFIQISFRRGNNIIVRGVQAGSDNIFDEIIKYVINLCALDE